MRPSERDTWERNWVQMSKGLEWLPTELIPSVLSSVKTMMKAFDQDKRMMKSEVLND